MQMLKTIKDLANSSFNVSSKIQDSTNRYANETANAIVKGSITQQLPWKIAQYRKDMIQFWTLPMQISTAYIQAWVDVMYPEPKKFIPL